MESAREAAPSLSPIQQSALASISAFESQLPISVADDKDKRIVEVFERLHVQASPTDRSAARIVLKEKIHTATKTDVSEGLLSVVEIVRTITPSLLSGKDRLNVDLFARQMRQFAAWKSEQRPPASLPAAEQQSHPAAQSREYPTVSDVKQRITKPLRSFWERVERTFKNDLAFPAFTTTCASALVFVTSSILAVIAAGTAIAAVPIFMASISGLGLVAGIVLFVIDHLRQKVVKEKLDQAKTYENIIPIFYKLSFQAQARLFVELGPDFRAKMCAATVGDPDIMSSKYWNKEIQDLKNIVDIIQDSPAESERTPSQKEVFRIFDEWRGYEFFQEVYKVLHEKPAERPA